RNGLTQEAVIRYYSAGSEDDKRKITTSVIYITLCTTLLISIVLLFFAPALSRSWDSPVMTKMFYFFLITFFISGILNVLSCIEQASLSFTGILYSNILRQFIVFIYPFYCFLTGTEAKLIFLVYVSIISVIAATIVMYAHARKHLLFAKKADFLFVRKILKFGVFTFGITISAVLATSIDQMMLGWLLSTAASGVFNVAIRITNMTDIPSNAMATIVYPQLSKRISSEGTGSAKYLYEKSVGVILAILVPTAVFLYLFSEPILHLIASEKYDESLPLLKITLIACLLGPFGRQAGTIFNSAGMARLNFMLVIITAALTIGTNFFFISKYGVMGAAYATLLSALSGTAIAFHFLKKHFGI